MKYQLKKYPLSYFILSYLILMYLKHLLLFLFFLFSCLGLLRLATLVPVLTLLASALSAPNAQNPSPSPPLNAPSSIESPIRQPAGGEHSPGSFGEAKTKVQNTNQMRKIGDNDQVSVSV